MPKLNEREMIAAAEARAKALNLSIRSDRPTGSYVRFRLTAGIVIPHDEILAWDKRTFLDSYPDKEYDERPAWNCMGKINARYRQLTGNWDAMPFTFVDVPFSMGRHDMMFIMDTRRGEWMNKNGRWDVQYVFDPELQFPPMPEKEEELREFLTKQMEFEKLGDYATIYESR
ncbi:hypothetical protein CYLTODRAFT_492162 [Cylindrobasidium torrendii FP15055 ss-10]|uniref:Uncharacterized protein n=1 Tax=Cylindrobasidium torrendii FP15055 ss-10 TaxID=1314674 RepID=A0A0D7B642_9AGAR|nr:hypothetical protein CYLTODRAFT_492162 [Cylindrobasidium torrendii FP15055 ss-10]